MNEITKQVDLQNVDVLNQDLKMWWKCDRGHCFQMRKSTYLKFSVPCPYCRGVRLIKGVNNLSIRFPQVLSEWDYEKNYPLTPDDVAAFSNRKVWWKCKNGHEYFSKVALRTAKHEGCPICAGKIVMCGFNDLKTKSPKIANEWNYEKNGELTPEMIVYGSSKKVWWKCNKGHEWQAVISSRTTIGVGCPVCAGRRVLTGFNDLKTLEPLIANQWCHELNGDLTPEQVTRASNKRVWWECEEGHKWLTSVGNRTVKKTDCPVCAGKRRNSNVIK